VGLLSELLLLPLAPARFALWTADKVVDAAAAEHFGPTAVRRELAELSRQLDQGLISAEEFDRREDEILERLAEGRRRGLIT
jgi:DNA-binding NarL/FixJ family response regulator